MEEAAENSKESLHSAHTNGMNQSINQQKQIINIIKSFKPKNLSIYDEISSRIMM